MAVTTLSPDILHALTDEASPVEGGGQRSTLVVYIVIHLLPFLAFWTGVTWIDAILCLVLLQVRGLCMSAGYHRYFAHRSFKTSRLFQFLLAAGGCSALRGGPLWWTALHRHHHRFSDYPEDAHKPEDSLLWSYCGWFLSGRYNRTGYRLVKDLARYPELRWLNRWWLLPAVVLAAVTYLIGGWGSVAIGFGLSSVLLFHTQSCLDALTHRFGSQRYQTGESSRNSWWVSLLSLGEGWHNNHHHYPVSCRSGFYWWEIDSTYDTLRLLAWCGIVWDLRVPPPHVLTADLVSGPEKD
jgi:stearoyl-CoA desaturase (delta-9 desaturase)